MDINWLAFVVVAAVTLVGALVVVGFYAVGIRLLAPVGTDQDGPRWTARAGAYACFGVCVVAVLYGIYLLVPAFGA